MIGAMPKAAATVTIPGVELVKAGTWHGRTGPVTITNAQLAAAVTAAGDPEVDLAALKFGHVPAFDATGNAIDGAPAYGWVQNLRTSPDGGTLLGDLVDVPVKLAAILPKAFRRRSAELAFGLKTPAGKVYAMVLTGLAALGATAPAVKGLADLPALYDLAGTVDADTVGTVELAAGIDDGDRVELLTAALAAVDALGLDEPKRASLAAEIEAAAGVVDASIPDAAESSRQNDGAPLTGPPAAAQPSQETETMDDDKLRKLLKLEADADLEAEVAKLIDAKPAPTEPTAEELAATAKAEADTAAAAEPETKPAGELVGAAALSADTLAALKAAGVAVVSEDVLATLTAGAATATATAAQLAEAERNGQLDEAIRTGRITPAERDKFEAILVATPTEGAALLSAMTPRFATAELGADLGPEADASIAEEAQAFVDSLGLK